MRGVEMVGCLRHGACFGGPAPTYELAGSYSGEPSFPYRQPGWDCSGDRLSIR